METVKLNTTKGDSTEGMLKEVAPIMLSQIIHASVEDVFDAWKEAHKMKQWCSPEGMSVSFVEIDFRIGGVFIWEMKNEDMDVFTSGIFEEIFPYRLIRCIVFFADNVSTVSMRFRPIGKAKTELLLNHQGIPESEQENCKAFWTSCLSKLKTLLEKH